jgi:hypothetical protein
MYVGVSLAIYEIKLIYFFRIVAVHKKVFSHRSTIARLLTFICDHKNNFYLCASLNLALVMAFKLNSIYIAI